MIKLRYDIDQLSREIVEPASGSRYKEVSPDTFIYKDAQELRKRAKPETKGLLRREERSRDYYYNIGGIRRISNDKGYTIFQDNETLVKHDLVWNMGNMKYIREGYVARIHRRKEMNLQLHIKKDGNVLFRCNKGGIKSLSFQNYHVVSGIIGFDFTYKLLTLKPNQDWLYELLQSQLIRNRSEDRPFLLGNNILQSAKSLQDFIDNINVRNHPTSAGWFANTSINDIVAVMKLRNDPTIYFNNATEYFDFIEQGGSSFDEKQISIGAIRRRNVVISNQFEEMDEPEGLADELDGMLKEMI